MPERVIAIAPETQRRSLLRDLKYGGLWLLAALLKSPRLVGYVGELRVHNCLLKGLPEGALILSNVMVPTAQGTAQVDLVVIVGRKVFSIEVKNRTGWVSGRERDHMWKWWVGRRKGAFYNPVAQSRKHAMYLGTILKRTVEPMVVFAGSARVNSDVPCVFDTPRRLVPALLGLCRGEIGVNDLAVQSQAVAQQLESIRLQGTAEENRKHIRYVRRVAAEKKYRTKKWRRHKRNP